MPAGEHTVETLLAMLEPERIDRDIYRAQNPPLPEGWPRAALFGGQVAAHALRAAQLTVEAPHPVHSLHGYFLRPGRDDGPTILRVDRIRDGRSFTTRTVVAQQEGEAIFSLTASFHRFEPGGETSAPMPDVPDPDELLEQYGPTQQAWEVDGPFERVEIPGFGWLDPSGDPRRTFWIRLRGPLPDDPALHACVLAYISDMGILAAVRSALDVQERSGMVASLDHAVWFHRPVRADGWLLFDAHGRANGGSRGLGSATIHTADGVHAATVAQEGLVRVPEGAV